MGYLSVLISILNAWEDVINDKKVYSFLNKTNVKCNVYVNFVIKNKNKKSAESDVAPAGIKSYKFLFILKKKNYFAVFKKLMG